MKTVSLKQNIAVCLAHCTSYKTQIQHMDKKSAAAGRSVTLSSRSTVIMLLASLFVR